MGDDGVEVGLGGVAVFDGADEFVEAGEGIELIGIAEFSGIEGAAEDVDGFVVGLEGDGEGVAIFAAEGEGEAGGV